MYTVRQGDYLAKIAKDHGFANWRTIYDDSHNQGFKQKRPNPNLIYPGDQLFIPEPQPKTVQVQTNQLRRFTLTKDVVSLYLNLVDAQRNALDILKYELSTIQETMTRKKSDPGWESLGQGVVQETFGRPETRATLKVWTTNEAATNPDFTYTLMIGHLDPIEQITGVQARLNNLGFDCGAVDGNCGPRTQDALKAFQKSYGLTVSGQPDGPTRDKLKAVYRC
jgi:N-acetylmuramoyl-L-alanine amidase